LLVNGNGYFSLVVLSAFVMLCNIVVSLTCTVKQHAAKLAALLVVFTKRPAVQVCDATTVAQRTNAGYIKKSSPLY
jgi:hypothetical protein